MPEAQSKETECDLRLTLFQYGGVSTSYTAKGGLKRGVVLRGLVDVPLEYPAPHFEKKPVSVTISSPPDPDWLSDVAAKFGVAASFGAVSVKASVEPEQFELDGETIEIEPVHVRMEMDPDTFETIRRQAAEAYDHRRIMSANVRLVGETLPDPSEKPLRMLDLGDLDVSEDREYAVGGFEILETVYTDYLRGRPLHVEPGRSEGYGVRISVLLTEARYEVSMERASVHSISCEGRVINGRGKPYDGADVTIEFGEHEPNNRADERAFAGEFGYFPKRSKEDYSSTHFWFHLRHVPEDARGLLIPLLSQETGTHVVLNSNLIIEEEKLLATVDELRGNVRYYSFKVGRHLINDGA
ncbi:MAG: hypothetical protein O7B98_05245 [Alphaproteobacteria bacterium]|nr:hypothetical protein [Alphaproteobacteria bacterium]